MSAWGPEIEVPLLNNSDKKKFDQGDFLTAFHKTLHLKGPSTNMTH